MKTRNFVLSALGLTAAFTFGGAETASAQARSQTRIPVRKDAPPMEMAKPDTVFIRSKPDTVMMMGRTDTVTVRMRPDTVMRMEYPPLGTMPGFEFGLGGGIAVPMNDWRNSTKDGPAAHVHLGFFPGMGALGLRFSGDAGFMSHRDTDCRNCPDPRVYSGAADVVLRFPVDRQGKLNPILYFLGGGGVDKFSNFLAYQADNVTVTAGSDTYAPFTAGPPPGVPGGTAVQITTANRGSKSLFYHYDVGAGLELGRGDVRFFIESKYTTINTSSLARNATTTSGTHNSHYFPIIAGINFAR